MAATAPTTGSDGLPPGPAPRPPNPSGSPDAGPGAEELFLAIGGMSCANCSRGIEKGLARLPGIVSARVYLADESAEIRFDPSALTPAVIMARIVELGYGARLIGAPREEPAGWAPVVFTAALALPVAALAMFGADVWPNRVTQLLLSGLILMTTGRHFFTGAVRSLKNRHANMDVLVALGVGAAWGYSALVMAWPAIGQSGMIHFETAAVLVLFISFGKTLEGAARARASAALRSLADLQRGTARRLQGGGGGGGGGEVEREVAPETLVPGDRVRILPGERFPVDGAVERGESDADESLLTGEAMPVTKGPGSPVLSGTVNLTGELVFTVRRSGAESTLQSLIRVMRRAQADKPSIQRFVDRVSDVFVPVVVTLAALTFMGWLWAGHGFGHALMHAVSVVVVACPCALGLATPTAVVIASGIALRRGLLVKKPSALEALAGLDFLLLDKTGTLTAGRPQVRRQEWLNGATPESVAGPLRALVGKSLHPLSRSLAEVLPPSGDLAEALTDVSERRGYGLLARDGSGNRWLVGNAALLAEEGVKPPRLAPEFAAEALTPVYVARSGTVVAVFGLADLARPEAPEVVKGLQQRGVTTVLVSGDREAPVKALAAALGITDFRSEVRPEGKLRILQEFQARGPTGFVGDGINDAPALSAANVGLAMGSGADAAREATDLVLVQRDLQLLPWAIDLARGTLAKIRQNLVWAVVYNLVALPLAAGVLVPFWGPRFSLTPEIAGLAMALSSVSVVLNSLSLRRQFPVGD